MSSNIPSAPTTAGAEPKKSSGSTAIIITLIIVFAVIVLPLIVGAIIVFAILGFVNDHIDDWDIDGIIHGIEYLETDGAPLTHNEAISVRNIVSQIESAKDKEGTISKLDCLYLDRIAKYYTEKQGVDYVAVEPISCDGEYLYGEATYSNKYDGDKVEYNNGSYRLSISDGVGCAEYDFNGILGSHNGYSIGSNRCKIENMVKLKIVDNGGELEPYNEYHIENGDGKEDIDDNIEINIKS